MFRLAKPRGFINYGRNLYIKPDVIRVKADTPKDILFISDIHLRRSHPELLDRLTEAIKDLRPGVILLGGDIAEYAEGFETAIKAIADTLPGIPMFLVPGNNDERACGGDREQQRKLLAKYNCTYLLNECKSICGMEILGTEECWQHEAVTKGLYSGKEGVYRVLLSHYPLRKLLDEADVKPDLMLCGHTHGGQVNVLGASCYFIGYEGQYRFIHLAGVKRFGKTLCIVSRGIGISKYPLRVGAKPEIYYIGRD